MDPAATPAFSSAARSVRERSVRASISSTSSARDRVVHAPVEARLRRDLGRLEIEQRKFRRPRRREGGPVIAKQQFQKREAGGVRGCRNQLRSRRRAKRERVGGAEHAGAEFRSRAGVALGGALEQRLPHRLDPHPAFSIGVVVRPMLVDPQRRRRGHLGRRRRGAVAVEIHDRRLAEPGPRHVRGIARNRRPHLGVRTVVAGHPLQREICVRGAVRHHAAGRDDPAESRRIHDDMRRRVAIVVSGRGYDHDAGVVKRVDCVRPCLGRKAAHAHAHDMDARPIRLAEAVDVVESLRDGAVAEQHDPVGDPNRDDLGVRRAAERLEARHGRAGQNAERAAAVAEIVECSLRPIRRIVRLVGVDEIMREIRAQVFGNRFVGRVVAGIEMSDPDPRASARLRECGIHLVMGAVAEPVVVVGDAGIAASDVLRMRPSGAGPELLPRIVRTNRPSLHKVRFDRDHA